MGRSSRAKRDRRLRKHRRKSLAEPSHKGEPLAILRSFHGQLQRHCHDSPRRCWEYMLEMIAQGTGWKTETQESKHLWEHFPEGKEIAEFLQCWLDEVRIAKENKIAFSEPIGELLEELEATNDNLGQFFTPMQVVRTMVEMQTVDTGRKGWLNGIDPCCGTGRFLIDTLVHTDNIMMGGVDLDLWLLRAAMVNARILGFGGYTNRYFENPEDRLQPFTEESTHTLRREGVSLPQKDGGLLVLAGRSRFIHGDALRVDLNYPFNWAESSWKWTPVDWSYLKMSAETVDAYRERVIAPIMEKLGLNRERAERDMGGVQFDYSMTDQQQAGM